MGKSLYIYITVGLLVVFGIMVRVGQISDKNNTAVIVDHLPSPSDSFDMNTLFKQCEQGNIKECEEELFALYNFGDMPKVIAISERMCDLNHGSYCSDLGTYYTDGIKGTTYDPLKGYRYFKRGCDLGSEYGCERLQEYSIVENKVVHHSEAKITKKTLACENGDVSACVDMAVIYHYGIGIGQNYDRALEYYDKGCNTKELNLDRRCEGSYDLLEATGRL